MKMKESVVQTIFLSRISSHYGWGNIGMKISFFKLWFIFQKKNFIIEKYARNPFLR